MTARPARTRLALLVLAVLIAAAGTIMWIAGLLRAAPTIEPGNVRSAFQAGGAFEQVIDLPATAPFDAAGTSVLQTARILASGRFPSPPPRLVVFDFRAPGPLMRLVYDPGVLAAGAASGSDPDHMLGLAGAGTRWPAKGGTALAVYCGRMETMTKPFCTRASGR